MELGIAGETDSSKRVKSYRKLQVGREFISYCSTSRQVTLTKEIKSTIAGLHVRTLRALTGQHDEDIQILKDFKQGIP